MRIKTKKEIKDIIKTMLEAHDYVEILLQDKRVAEARNLLAQCQECALHVGESIEKSEGMGTRMVSNLENYYEQLYVMCGIINKKKIIRLKKQLDAIIESVSRDLDEQVVSDKMKVVFMPYKVSMWDCMESVWEASIADKECEVFVVPIPYYERNQQGDIEKMCYEGDLFPEYVPIVSYEEFSLEEESPDVVYIHNPYDGTNYVTSVHPDYYTSIIKKYTSILVYIPYYITGEGPLPEMHRNLQTYQYIDKIIVQDTEKKKSIAEYVPEEKIVVLGSPKVDYLQKINKQKENIIKLNIPQEWKEKIKEKNIILFNVSITGILQNSKYAMAKIRYILSGFKHYENVVLLWRPHPLVEATLKSMRPEMYDEYMAIKKEFIQEGKGILDETGNAGIAAVIADAYLGENSSSLVHYFGVLGKPVLYIDWTITENFRKKTRDYLYTNSYFREKDKLYFLPANKGITYELYQLNMKTGIIKKYMTLPGMPENISMCYSQIKRIKNKIILVPCNTEDLYVYDMEKEQAIKIILPNIKGNKELFNGAVEYEDKIFLIPKSHHAIICVDIMQYRVVSEFSECIKPFLLENNEAWLFTTAYLMREQYLYLATCNDSRILVLNVKNGSYEIKKIGEYSYGYVHMIYDGKYFWLAGGGIGINRVVRWEEESGNTREYSYPIGQDYRTKNMWSLLVDNDDSIIVCYGFLTDMAVINKETGDCQRYKGMDEMFTEMRNETDDNSNSFVFAEYIDKRTMVAINWENCSFNLWNVDTNQRKSLLCRLSPKELLNVEKKQIERWKITKSTPYNLSENDISVEQFIDYIAIGNVDIFNRKYEAYTGSSEDLCIGTRVHEYIKGELSI